MRKRILIGIGIIVAVALLAFAYYALSPLFRTIKVDEQAPVATASGSETRAATVVGTTGHPASGTVRIIEGEGKQYVRYENYKTINGPDLYVYLAKDLDAEEFVNLGRLRATEGNVNYEIPEGVDVAEYTYALTWCKAFGVLFNYADLGS